MNRGKYAKFVDFSVKKLYTVRYEQLNDKTKKKVGDYF